MGDDYYALLDARREAAPAELRRCYELALQRASRDGATKRSVDIVQAYDVLSNPARRSVYDRTGFAVIPDRIPNTYGRAIPFRGGTASTRSRAPGRQVLPGPAPRRRGPVLVGVAVLALASAAGGAWLSQRREPAPSRVIPVDARTARDGLLLVRCVGTQDVGAYSFAARPGAVVHCTNGAIPVW